MIRISNSGAATAAVSLLLKSPFYSGTVAPSAVACTTSTLSKLDKVPANGELAIDSSDLFTCFGAFKRGDIVVTIQGSPTNLSAKARTTTVSGTNEISLGGLDNIPGIDY